MSNETENSSFKKDETPYLIFPCSKCKQFHYVKTTQKTRKCLRCGRAHKVESYLDKGEIVSGMTAALELVKKKQNTIGAVLDFKSESDFVVAGNIKPFIKRNIKPQKKLEEDEIDYYDNFLCMLDKIIEQYTIFPMYILRMMALEYGIPDIMIVPLKNKALKLKKLVMDKDDYFKIGN